MRKKRLEENYRRKKHKKVFLSFSLSFIHSSSSSAFEPCKILLHYIQLLHDSPTLPLLTVLYLDRFLRHRAAAVCVGEGGYIHFTCHWLLEKKLLCPRLVWSIYIPSGAHTHTQCYKLGLGRLKTNEGCSGRAVSFLFRVHVHGTTIQAKPLKSSPHKPFLTLLPLVLFWKVNAHVIQILWINGHIPYMIA